MLLYVINKTMMDNFRFNNLMHGGTTNMNSKRCFEGCADTYKTQLDQLGVAKSNFDSCVTGCNRLMAQSSPPSAPHAPSPSQSQQSQQELCTTNCAKNCMSLPSSVDRSLCANRCVSQCKPQTH
jgi:hypothetical protein